MRLLLLPLLAACAADADADGFTTRDDCDDADPDVFPDATEWCNGVDDDCDGTVDEPDAMDSDPYWVDFDQDGFGDAAGLAKACSHPFGWAVNDDDCDDGDEDVNPDATEIPGNGVDEDCVPDPAD